MNEHSQTLIPGAMIYRPHQETGVAPMSIIEEIRRANEEAANQSTGQRRITND